LEGFSVLRSSQRVPKMVPTITWSILGVEAKEKVRVGANRIKKVKFTKSVILGLFWALKVSFGAPEK
jgi:hypothetical protein